MKNICIYIIISLFEYFLDIFQSPCSTIMGNILLLIHHFVGIYLFIGGFLFNNYYHLLVLILVIIHWITNNNRCELTIITNNYCKYHEDKKYNDFPNMINVDKNLYWIIIFILIIYDICKIRK